MNTFDIRHEPVVYRVGGRLYRLANLSPSCVRLQDLLDGGCLTFTQAEALQMIVQKDLIVLRRSSLQDRREPDPREPSSSPGRPQGRAHEQLIAATDPRWQRGRQPIVRWREAPGPAPRGNGAANLDPCRCTRQLEWIQAQLSRLGYPMTAPGRSIILDAVQYYLNTSAVTQAHSLILRKIYAQASRLCDNAGAIGRCKASEQRWLAAHRNHCAAASGGDRRKVPAVAFLGTLDMPLHSLLIGRTLRAEPEQPVSDLARLQRAALERAPGWWATADREQNSAPGAEVDDVE